MTAHVIGAGLSGLASAWHLVERGAAVTVFESSSRPGGLIHTLHTEHGLVETAANAFVREPRVDEWFARLGLRALSPASTSRRRYIFRDGRPRRWPLRAGESVAMGARIAMTGVSRGFAARADETIASWGERVVGLAATRWLLEPAMQGIYGAPASMLSANVIFGGRRKGRREMIAPAAGMGSFAASLHQHLVDRGVRFVFDHDVAAIDPAVPTIIATNAPQAARLLHPCASALASRLEAVRMAPLVTVTAFFTPSVDDPRGFGVLFPAESRVSALGVLFNADIFDGRSTARSETWIVGDRASNITTRSDARSVADARKRSTEADRAFCYTPFDDDHSVATGHSRV